MYDGGCTYTHLLHAHFSAHSALTAYFAHFSCVSHTRMAQGSSHVKKMFAHVSLFSISPSPFSCLTHPSCSRTVTSRPLLTTNFTDDPIHMILPYFPVLKAQDTQRRTCIAKFGYLANSDVNTGYEPKEFDNIGSVDDHTMLINDPNHNFSDFSQTTNENTTQFGVPTVFESSVLHVCHDDFALQTESKESMQSGNRC